MQKMYRNVLGINKFSGLIIFLISGMVLFGLLGVGMYFNSNIENKPLQDQDHISYSPDTPIELTKDKPIINDSFLKSNGYLNELEMVSECGSSTNHETGQGYISFTHNIPDVLPLCYNNFTDWHITATVYGGYMPWNGTVTVCQKGEIVGTFPIIWTNITDPNSGCCYSTWDGMIYIDKLCLDSSQVPVLYDPNNNFDSLSYCGVNPGDYITGKEVDFSFSMLWSGCHEVNQSFTILSFPLC